MKLKDFINEAKFRRGYWVVLSGKAGELDREFASKRSDIKKILMNWASSLDAGDIIKIERGESELDEAAGQNMLWDILDQKKASKLMDYMDEQSQELLTGRDGILDRLGKVLTLPGRYGHAFNRLQNLINSSHKNEGIIRNQIFKIADELGIKLPSSMF